jgi:single-strand DNA-binding protein
MNSCILMAEIIQAPELRYTSDNQTPIAEMLVQFPGLRDEDALSTLKVVGWGNLAQEIQEQYHQGDRVVIEGRLGMISLDRPEGFKEKRAELTVQRIHRFEGTALTTHFDPAISNTLKSDAQPRAQATTSARQPAATQPAAARSAATPSVAPAKAIAQPEPAQDFDDIPF